MFRDYCVVKFSQLTSCPMCGEPRFKSDNKSPRKGFKFLSVATRIKRFFGTYQTSILLKGHSQSEADTVAGIHGSPAWKEYGKDGVFGGDTRAISLQEHIVKLLSGIEDSVKARREEQRRKCFKCA